ncbi:MAG: hypothetical protein Q9183_005749, partial [Haloplaca sp. 2 TL-2023]
NPTRQSLSSDGGIMGFAAQRVSVRKKIKTKTAKETARAMTTGLRMPALSLLLRSSKARKEVIVKANAASPQTSSFRFLPLTDFWFSVSGRG